MQRRVPRIVVDLDKVRFINCGLGRFSLNLGREILKLSPGRIDPVLLIPRGVGHLFEGAGETIDAVRWRRESVQRFVRPIARLLGSRRDADLWHVTNQMSRYLPMDPEVPVLLTVHDLNFLHEPVRGVRRRRAAAKLADLRRRVDRACAVATDSHFVAEELSRNVDLAGRPLHVITLGVEPLGAASPARPSWMEPGPYLLTVGNCLPHKNFHSLLPILERLPYQRLVIAGKGATPYGEFLAREVSRRGLKSRVVMAGEVSDGEREWLYRHCDAFLFASVAEGFGLPALEAMLAGRPVLVSRLTSLPEVVGEHGGYLDLESPDADATKVRERIDLFKSDHSHAEAARMHAMSHSWSKTAMQYLELYERYSFRVTTPLAGRTAPMHARCAARP